MDNEKKKKNFDHHRYFEWSKLIIDHHLKIDDYQSAFFSLVNSLRECDQEYLKDLSKYFNDRKKDNIKN